MDMIFVFLVASALCHTAVCDFYFRNYTSGDFTMKIDNIEESECTLYCENYQNCNRFATETDAGETSCYVNTGLEQTSISLTAGNNVEIWIKGMDIAI